ncbi:hypothetical protein CLW00_11238 [Mongoliibacter ruber]|uniref:Uncharacterized protein n=1 Tax=Mongoliibacter ruber TaxID=1750599 RepID=A0A2T0WFG8_9BACT|nr:hypothetical protein CLW00_11238 [Mongoliibacter ruber]
MCFELLMVKLKCGLLELYWVFVAEYELFIMFFLRQTVKKLDYQPLIFLLY